VNDGLDLPNLRVPQKMARRQPQHRLATDLPILLGSSAATADPAAGGDDQGGNGKSHKNLSFLASLPRFSACPVGRKPNSQPAGIFALQHLLGYRDLAKL
jgi:hypothetical protein